MKKTLLLAIPLISTTTLLAQTTMCYKENHNSLSTIENIKLDGGECKGKFSLKEMKEKEWEVKDIKITPKNTNYDFVYILNKKDQITITSNSLDIDKIKENVVKKIEEDKAKKEKEEEKNQQITNIKEGKVIYSKCVSCHGQKGEVEAYDSAEALNTLSYDDMKFAINQYTFNGDYGNGNEMIMKPYASNLDSQDVKKVYEYLKSINK